MNEEEIELSTGIIRTSGYAVKLRKVMLARFKKIIPINVIIRDISEYNKYLYSLLIQQMKLEKNDLIKLTIKVSYNKDENKFKFSLVNIEKYLAEKQLKEKINEELKNYIQEINNLKSQIENLKSEYEFKIASIKKEYEEKIENYKNEIQKVSQEYQKKIENLSKEIEKYTNFLRKLYEDMKEILSKY